MVYHSGMSQEQAFDIEQQHPIDAIRKHVRSGEVVTKSELATLLGVSQVRLYKWLLGGGVSRARLIEWRRDARPWVRRLAKAMVRHQFGDLQ